MNKMFLSLAVILLGLGSSFAQNNGRLKYSGMVNIGALTGANKTQMQLQTIHGVANAGWFAGLGAGIDDYFQHSVPVFVDVRKDIINKASTPFVYAEGGLNIISRNSETEWRKTSVIPGLLYEGGVGYKIELNEKLDMNLAAGYSFKSYIEDTYVKATLPTPPYRSDEWMLIYTEKYYLRRLVFKIGLQF